MNKRFLYAVIAVVFAAPLLFAQGYIIIGWNDLGMHCANQDFSSFVVLPPFNNVHAQAIKVGDALNPPMVITTNYHVTYEIPGNTYSIGKTNFWDYDSLIFGVNLPPNIGLTGNGLTGNMTIEANNFFVSGIPITPYTDADLVHEDPFQLGLLKLYDSTNQLLATAPPVIPVSNEINCVSSGCHSSAQAILNQHEEEGGFNPNNTPILCATCHSSNALGTPGHPGLPSLSQVVHEHHGGITNNCYKCHPGPNTQCLRDIMSTQHGMVCQDCHGSVAQVGQSIDNGREPWLEEPSCGAVACHGPQYAEEPGKLFRQSRGHGGLFCSACHGEPHAIVTSRVARDNVENIALQGYAGTLNKCEVCHGIVPSGPGPHGIVVSSCNYMPGDLNSDGQRIGGDVTYGVRFFKGIGGVPPDSCHMDSTGAFLYVAGDVNGNCEFRGSDITRLVAYFKSTAELSYCHFFPPPPLRMH
jgi:hypothetical protein